MSTPCKHETDFGALAEWKTSVDKKLDEILVQTKATNGRVRALEKWRIGLATALGGLLVGAMGGSELAHRVIGVIAGGM